MTSSTSEALPVLKPRLLWMDNLRSIIIFFVVLYHIGGVYESAGLWGWLWFLPVLFVFNMAYILLSKMNLKMPKVSPGFAVLGAVIIGFVYSFSMGGLAGFRSWTLTPLIDFENERLLVYFLSFLLGALFYEQGVFAQKPKGKRLYNTVNAIAWLPVMAHIIVRLIPFFSEGDFAVTPVYRLMWWVSFDLALLCMMYVMVETFRRYFDKPGKTWSALNRNSYSVYIIHVIMIGIFGTFLMKLGLPVYLKYPLLIILTYLGSNLLVSGYKNTVVKIMP